MSAVPAGGREEPEASLVKQALAAVRTLQTQLDETRRRQAEPVAILGMGCRYPGAESPEALWQLLLRGEDAISDVPRDRWNSDALYDRDVAKRGKLPSRRGGFLAGLDQMDAAFFGVSPREAPHVDPRQRVMLEIAWEALEDAGILPGSLAGSRTGVFLATLTNDYDHLLFDDLRRAEIYSGAGTANSVVANRLSYFLDLHGPSLALDTACSGSLAAVHLACESLRSGESTLALVGGVSINLMAKSNVFFARSGALSPSGLCRTFDASADGIVRSDGAGIVVLKRLSEALRDGDPVLAVIRGSAVNHDGHSNGIMAPNGEAQRAVLAEAYRRAGVSASAVQYVELHGTGTPLGDPIEAQALLDVLGPGRAAGQECLVGSVKSNVGHTEAAAGIGGIVKTVLAMRYRQIPATAHFEKLNPLIPFDGTPFRVAQAVQAWPSPDQPLLAGVSGFGFGGTNAHVVIEGAPAESTGGMKQQPAYLLPVSAATPQALVEMASRYAEHLDRSSDAIGEICATAARRRSHSGCRIAVAGGSKEELALSLRASPPLLQNGFERGKLAFIFSGQGSHWPGMGQQLYTLEPVFRETVDRCEALVQEQWGWSLQAAMHGDGFRLNDTEIVQPAIFAMQAALGALWRSWGITPDFVAGHSLGEAAAAYFAGVLRLEDAMRVVVLRSRLMKQVAGYGKTAVVGMTLKDAEHAIAGLAPQLAVAGSNSPSASVISGAPEAVEQLVKKLKQRGIFCREVAGVDIAFHSPQMEPLQRELSALLGDLRPGGAAIPVVSTVTGDLLAGEKFDAAYWGKNLREPFLFTQATQCLLQLGCSTFLEVSPHAVLSSSIMQTAKAHGAAQVSVLASLRRGAANELRSMYETLASLYAQGRNVDWQGVYPERGRCVSLPHTAWQRQRYWFDQLNKPDNHAQDDVDASGSENSTKSVGASEGHPLLGGRVDVAFAPLDGATSVTLWQSRLSGHAPRYLTDHRVQGEVIVPGAAWLEMAREAGEQIFASRVSVREISFATALILNQEQRELQSVLTRRGGEAAFEIFSRVPQGTWVRHVHGTICAQPAQSSPMIEAQVIRVRCTRAMTVQSHYAAMQEKGLEYGPAFRLLTEIVGGESEAMGRIELPEGLSITGYGMHPAMLDAALQLAAVAQGQSEHSYLPIGVKSFEFFEPLERQLWCYAALHGASGDATLEADLSLINDADQVLARVTGLKLQRMAVRRSLPSDWPIDWKDALIQERWVPQPLSLERQPTAGKWLIFTGTEAGELAGELAFQLAKLGHSATLVRPGAGYRRVHESGFELSADLTGDVARLLQEDFWSCVVLLPDSDEGWGPKGVAGCGLALAVAQAMLDATPGTFLRMVTQGGQAVPMGKDHVIDPWQAPLAGLALAVAYEHPELRCSLIDLELGGSSRMTAELANELLLGGEEVQVAWRGGERFVSRIERAAMPLGATTPLNPEATYLITGGLGSLGWKTAERMVRDGARYLVLTSRSAADSAAVEALRATGVAVTVAACDLSQADEVDRLFDETLTAMPPLRGVVHSAGVVEDALLPQQTLGSFRKVMEAKVTGSWNLHRRTQSLPLDFFVMYSSAASLIGSGGQANYAAANSFLDALAHYRRSLGLTAVSLNWGAWGGDGMAARPEVLERLNAAGIATIPAATGLDLLSAVLAGTEVPAQFGVFPANWKKFVPQLPARMRARLSTMVSQSEMLLQEQILNRVFSASPAEARKILRGYLQRVLAMVLGYTSAEHLNPEQRFFDLGMDSLTAVEFRNRLQEELQTILPATLAFDYPEIGSLAEFLAAAIGAAKPNPGPEAEAGGQTEASAEAEELEALSGFTSDELARLLVEELAEGGSNGR